jgi:streptomycin 6-kinase
LDRFAIPDGLAAAVAAEEGEAASTWLRSLPTLVAELVELWDLELAAPYEGAHVSWAAPVRRRRDRAELVLKVQAPSPESAPEALALAAWSGEGAIRLHEHDPERCGLLIERCEPGTALQDEPDPVAALEEGLRVAAVLHQAPPPAAVPPHAEAAVAWADRIEERRALVPDLPRVAWDLALELLRSRRPSDRQVLLHGDLNPTNVLRSERGWLAIDPKPLVGDPATDAARLVLQLAIDEGADRTAALGRRCELAGAVLGVSPESVARWCVVDLVGVSTWFLHTGRAEDARRQLELLPWLLPHIG